jgi:protein SCO1
MSAGNRRLQIALAAITMLLVIAAGAVLALGTSGGSRTPVSNITPTGSGPFLTASTIPPGLADHAVPKFDLTDARGGRLSSSSLQGRPYALTFLYVRCVNVCPLIGSEIHDALAKLGPYATNMNVVAVSVDPRGDTRRAVREWLAQHHEPANFHYLIGTQHELAPVWKAFYISPQTPGDPQSSHTAVIWLINNDDRVAALISAGVPIDTTNLAHDFRTLIRRT